MTEPRPASSATPPSTAPVPAIVGSSCSRSPGGAGGVNGSRFPLDRVRVAELLGFAEVVTHTRDAIWQTDGFSDLVSHAAIAATGVATRGILKPKTEPDSASGLAAAQASNRFCAANSCPSKDQPILKKDLYPIVMATTLMVGLTDTWLDLRARRSKERDQG